MRAFVVTVPVAEAELASDDLWALGVLAVEERPVSDDVVELWTSIGAASTGPAAGWRWPWRFVDVDDDVVDTWRRFAQPVAIGDVALVPAWVEPPAGMAHVIRIEPGSTFGLGDHPTTRLCLAALQRCVRAGDTVIDVGSGSGVLSVAARLFGAASVWATDIAAEAVTIGEANAARNSVDGIEFTTAPVGADQRADVVVANILAPTLVALAPSITAAASRTAILSGLLDGRFDHVVEAMSPLEVVGVDELDGWVAVELQVPVPTSR